MASFRPTYYQVMIYIYIYILDDILNWAVYEWKNVSRNSGWLVFQTPHIPCSGCLPHPLRLLVCFVLPREASFWGDGYLCEAKRARFKPQRYGAVETPLTGSEKRNSLFTIHPTQHQLWWRKGEGLKGRVLGNLNTDNVVLAAIYW